MLREIAEVDKKIGLLGKQQFAVEKIALSQLSQCRTSFTQYDYDFR